MREQDKEGVIELRRSYGQHMGIGALDTLMKCDPDGIYVAVDEDGQVHGSCAAIDLHPELACVMLHSVRAEHQKSGLATRLWREAVERRLGGDRNAFLICGGFHVAMYHRRFGFEAVSAERIHYIRPGPADTSSLPRSVDGVQLTRLPEQLSPEDHGATVSAVVDYDAAVFGFRREQFLRLVLAEKGNAVVVARRGDDSGAIVGYGVVSTDISGRALLRIVYADEEAIAEGIVYHLLESFTPFHKKGLTGLLLAGAGEGRGIDHKMALETVPYVNILYRREEPTTCDYRRQFVVPV
ncbi:hypothetical protein V5799_023815 [Amblyomma americanum]|uniref:N-acetyltransferase domain-containing protein n=1 Tax=Amblyomma americanum TaxID=6943 RepID=A0AAQ4FGZ3_AMBAM